MIINMMRMKGYKVYPYSTTVYLQLTAEIIARPYDIYAWPKKSI